MSHPRARINRMPSSSDSEDIPRRRITSESSEAISSSPIPQKSSTKSKTKVSRRKETHSSKKQNPRESDSQRSKDKVIKDKYKVARNLFGYLALIDGRFKQLLQNQGFSNAAKCDQNGIFFRRESMVFYVTPHKTRCVDLSIFRATLYSLLDGPWSFQSFCLRAVPHLDCTLFFVLIIDFLFTVTVYNGNWPGTQKSLNQLVLLRRSLVNYHLENKQPLFTYMFLHDPSLIGPFTGDFGKADREDFCGDPDQLNLANCKIESGSYSDAVNAVIVYFMIALKDDSKPKCKSVSWMTEAFVADSADAKMEMNRASFAGLTFLKKTFGGYYLVCDRWPQVDYEKYCALLNSHENLKFLKTDENFSKMFVPSSTAKKEELEKNLEDQRKIAKFQRKHNMNTSIIDQEVEKAERALMDYSRFELEMRRGTTYSSGSAPGFTCPGKYSKQFDFDIEDNVDKFEEILEKKLGKTTESTKELIKANNEKEFEEFRSYLKLSLPPNCRIVNSQSLSNFQRVNFFKFQFF